MSELLKILQVVGVRRMLQLYRAQRLGWKGIISGFYTTRVLQALFSVGFFDELQQRGVVDLESFAAANGLDEQILQSLCDSLYALRILKRQRDGYGLDSRGRLLAEVGRGWFYGVYGYEGVFHSLEDLLKKEKVYGKDIRKRADYVARGSEEMESWVYFPLAIDIISRNNYGKVLDLGCGEATFLRNLCEKIPEVMGYGVDMAPEPVRVGIDKVARACLQNRIQLVVGDFTRLEDLPHSWHGIDVATAFFVLHEILYHGPECVVDFLRKFRAHFPDVPLIVFDVIRPAPDELRRRPGMVVQYILHHDLTHQRLTSVEEWRSLFRQGGFSTIEERYSSLARTAIFTVR